MYVSARSGLRSGAFFGFILTWFMALVGCGESLTCCDEGGHHHTPTPTPTPCPSCPTPTPTPSPTPTPTPGTTAQLRIIHSSPDSPAIDVYLQGDSHPLFTNLAYGDASAYATVTACSSVIELRAAGSSASSAPIFTSMSFDFMAGQVYSGVIAGLRNATASDTRLRIINVQESWGDAPSGQARIRFVHASPDFGPAGFDINDDGIVEVTNVDRFQSSGADGFLVQSGVKLQVNVRVGGNRYAGFTLPALNSGDKVLVILTGLNSLLPRMKEGLSLLVVGKSHNYGFVRRNPQVYFTNASPDVPNVDMFSGQAKTVNDLMFGELVGPIEVPPGDYSLALYAHSASTVPPTSNLLHTVGLPGLAAGERYLAVVMGFGVRPSVTGMGITSQVYREGFLIDQNNPLMRAINAIPDSTSIDVGEIPGGGAPGVFQINQNLRNLVFTAASAPEGAIMSKGTVEVAIAQSGSTFPLASFTTQMAAGQRLFGVFAGALAPESYEMPLNLFLINTSVTPWTITVYPDKAW